MNVLFISFMMLDGSIHLNKVSQIETKKFDKER